MALAVDVESQRNDAAKADAALRALTARHPNKLETALATANLAMSRRQFPTAIAAYRNVLALGENTANLLSLAGAHIAANELPKAVGLLENWLKKHPSDQVAMKALAQAQFRAGALAPARIAYAKALAAEPDNAAVLNDFANLLLRMGDEGAQAAAERAVKAAPGEPAYTDTLGWIMVRKGQTEAGLRYLREARLRSPENPEIRYHLAFALFRSGRTSEAREELKVALAGGAQFEGMGDAIKLKRELGL
jgi:Flp pilus assembly protein TadD